MTHVVGGFRDEAVTRNPIVSAMFEIEAGQMTLETRMLHDLRLMGDNFLDTLEILDTEFDVDMSEFDWSRYTPSDGELLFPWLPIAWLLGKFPRPGAYEPLTLGMIAVALKEKRWQSH